MLPLGQREAETYIIQYKNKYLTNRGRTGGTDGRAFALCTLT